MLVAKEVNLTGLVDRAGHRLGRVVQQRRPADGEPGRCLVDDPQRMNPDVLVSPFTGIGGHRDDLRQHVWQYVRLARQRERPRRGGCDEQLVELRGDALATDPLQLRGHLTHGVQRLRVEDEVELGDEAQRPQDPQWVFAEAVGAIPNRANHPSRQIHMPVEGIDDLTGMGVDRHGVDGEIAPREISDDVGVVMDGRAPVRGRIELFAVGRDLDQRMTEDEPDGAELLAHGVHAIGPGGRAGDLCLRWIGVGGEIEVGDRLAQEQATNAAADEIELVPVLGEDVGQSVGNAPHR